jgi:uncharacterized phage protein (TIGR01671 family)
MTREILFRGLRVDGKGWAYGYLKEEWTKKGAERIFAIDCADIFSFDGESLNTHIVHPHTVGQFTGLLDKNGVKVFEGDIIHSDNWNPCTYKVIFEDGEFCFVSLNESEKPYTNSIHYVKEFQIIGNIHEEAQP